MSDTRTASMLKRLPIILAVTAASYGLPLQAQPMGRADTARTDKTASGPGPATAAPKAAAPMRR